MQTALPLRSLCAEDAVQLALHEAERLGMRFERQLVSTRQCEIVVSHLMRGDTQVVASGVGRGGGLRSVAGAYFEALERYYMSARINRRLASDDTNVKSARNVAQQPTLVRDLVIQRWAKDYPDSKAACAIYSNRASSIWYPIFLTDPRYHRGPLRGDSIVSYRSMLRYTASIGTAAGANPRESCLHGLCELIEHDALSHALLRWIIARDPLVRVLNIASLSDDAQRIHGIAAESVGEDVVVLDVTTDLGIPAYLAVKSGDGAETGLLGMGASPVGEHAVVRALSELIQVAVTSDGIVPREENTQLAKWPLLQRCFTTPLGSLANRSVEYFPLRETVCNVDTVEACLDGVTGLLHDSDIHWSTCELAPPGSLISVTSTIAPGLERFSLVRYGLPVVPTGRGWDLWRTSVRG